MRKLFLFLLAVPLLAQAQDKQYVSFGVIGGVPISDAFETFQGNDSRYVTNTKRYVVGPTIAFHMPFRLALEIDALYKRLGYQYQTSLGTSLIVTNTVANSWEFPAMVRWEVLPGPVRPFVDVGGSLRHISGIDQIRTGLGDIHEFNNAVEFNKRNDVGLVFGGGVAFKAGPFRIAPQLRYTRWGSENFRDPVNALLRTNRNQGDFLLGLTF